MFEITIKQEKSAEGVSSSKGNTILSASGVLDASSLRLMSEVTKALTEYSAFEPVGE